MRYHFRSLAFLVLLLPAAGCSSLQQPPDWRGGLLAAATDRDVWIPAVTAGIVGVAGMDGRISDWAMEKTPLFGSNENADRWSDDLKFAAHVAMIGTALTITTDDSAMQTRLVRVLEQELIARAADAATTEVKRAVDRERPDAFDRLSFPSGHATGASAYRMLTESNLERSNLSPGWQRTIGGSSRALTIGTAWARIEAGKHYPTDVLVGAAVGGFLSRFADEMLGRRGGVELHVAPSRDGVALFLRIRD